MSSLILTNISRLNADTAFSSYNTEDMGKIKGRYTNEAPVKYLLNTVYKNVPETECTIIAITTREAEEAFTAFRKTIRRFCNRKGYKGLSIEKVTFEERRFGSVISKIAKAAKNDDKVFIDTTGGFRDSVYLLMAVVRILEYSGVKLEKAVYSIYNKHNSRENKIVDITDTYNMFNLINAADSFTSLGNSDELAHFFLNCDNSDIKRIIDVMNRFSDEVALCRTSKLDALISELNEVLINIQNLDTVDENEILFKSLTAVIREKFRIEDEETIDYPDVIRWCLDNKMIQQAVTIYVEKMPEYLFNKGIVSANPLLIDMARFPKSFDKYYNLLYNGFLRQVSSVTRSPYPIGNLLLKLKEENQSVYKELCNISNINDLSIKSKLTADERNGILNLIRVKNVIFTGPTKKRTPEDVEQRKQNTKLRDFIGTDIFETGATTSEAFVNGLLSNKDYLKLIQGEFTPYIPKVWNGADINVIEHLERVLSENNNMYSVSKKISLDDMKKILMNLVYVKRYVRNSLNHASEEKRLADEYNEYFSNNGYSVSSELSVKEIEGVMHNALNLIQSLSI